MSSIEKRTDTGVKEEQQSGESGRIQVSANRLRRFYVYASRRLLAANPHMKKIDITALGSAITSAIGIAHELEDTKVARIVSVQTFYQPLKLTEEEPEASEQASSAGKTIARILIVVERNPDWVPEESDFHKPQRRETTNGAPKSSSAAPAAGSSSPRN